MKVMSRDFTRGEKLLILLLALVLLALAYYWFVDQPVRRSIANAKAEADSLETELVIANAELSRLQNMQDELDKMESSGAISRMASYNNSEEELHLLNDILADTMEYSISFSDATRNGDQIRRNFSLQFKTADYNAARTIIDTLDGSELRCLIGDIRCTVNSDETVTVNAAATFFETMVGGTPDSGLPADAAAADTTAEDIG